MTSTAPEAYKVPHDDAEDSSCFSPAPDSEDFTTEQGIISGTLSTIAVQGVGGFSLACLVPARVALICPSEGRLRYAHPFSN